MQKFKYNLKRKNSKQSRVNNNENLRSKFSFLKIKNYKLKTNSGFSLIEMLIYVATLVLVLLIIINTTLLMAKAYSGMKISYDINNSAVNIMERVAREIRWSEDVNLAQSVFNLDAGILSLNSLDDLGGIVEKRFFIEGENLMFREAMEEANPLNINGIKVNRFFLTRVDLVRSKMIKIELELEGQLKDKIKTETFYNSIIMRESY